MNNVIDRANALLKEYPKAIHESKETIVHVEADGDNGFYVMLSLDSPDRVNTTLYYGNWHNPFDDDYEKALDIFEKCLTGSAKLVEITKLGVPCHGILEIYDGENQSPKEKLLMGTCFSAILFLFPGKKKIFINNYKKANKSKSSG